MAITYPLNMPSTKFRRFSLTCRSAVSVLQSPFTYQTQVQRHQGQIWLADVTLPAMERAEAEKWAGFILALNGPEGTFLLGDPLGALPKGAASGVPLINGGSQTGNSLVTDGWTPSVTGILKAGDYLQIGTYLYRVMQDVDSDSGGNATVDIYPRLRVSPANNDTILTVSCKGTFRLIASSNPMPSSDENQVYDFGFQAIEAI